MQYKRMRKPDVATWHNFAQIFVSPEFVPNHKINVNFKDQSTNVMLQGKRNTNFWMFSFVFFLLKKGRLMECFKGVFILFV